ncbi:aldehyde dehydrogenase family protein [bacterium]|nr:aldehyde dehydrogenase family protein [bacterium]
MNKSGGLNLFPKLTEIPENAGLFEPIRGRLLVGGELIQRGFETRPVTSPILLRSEKDTLEDVLLGETPQATSDHVMQALAAATQAWKSGTGEWPSARMERRLEAIALFTQRMQAHRETIVRLLMWEIGKTRGDAESEFDRTIVYINDTLEAAKGLDRDSSRLQFAQGYVALVRRMPLGVTLCMGPFNYPLNETFTTLIPALVMGNTTLVKVPRYGQLLWDCLLPEFQSCFPAGVVNVINGSGREIIGAAMRSGDIDVLAFIGSSQVANTLKSQHPRPNRLRSILGLDAKNPAIILPDAPVDLSIDECIKGALSFNGQRCTALKLLCVHDSIAEHWTQKLAERVAAMKIGMPWEPGVKITPLPDTAKPGELRKMVEDAVADGAILHNSELALRGQATLIRPAVVSQVKWSHSLAQVEQFGPVIPVIRFNHVDEVVEQLVASQYGMQVSLFGRDARQLGPLVDALSNQVARININASCQRGPDVFPFTGRKNSAEGTLSVSDALRAFSLRTMVATSSTAIEGRDAFRGILEHDTSNFLTNHVIL